MGYFLFYESMLPAVIHARDKWLVDGGITRMQHATGILQHATGILQHATGILQHATGILQHATGILQRAALLRGSSVRMAYDMRCGNAGTLQRCNAATLQRCTAGLILPDKASLILCAIEDAEYKAEKIDCERSPARPRPSVVVCWA
jgi:hypothetical protein